MKQHHRRAIALSSVVVVVVALPAAAFVLRAFQLLGGQVNQAGFGALLFLAMSLLALIGGLFAIFDLVYLLNTGNHLIFRPLRALNMRWALPWLPPLAIVLGIVAGHTIFT